MSPRKYDLGKRAEAAEATRRRIVEATFEVHNEKGIADTTYRDIAERADVSLATVYRHFPEYQDVVVACGALSLERLPMPEPAALEGSDDRVAAMVDAVFTLYEASPGMLARLRLEQHKVPVLAMFLAGAEQTLEGFVRTAMPDLDDDGVTTVLALVDEGVHRSLTASGLTPTAARARVTALIHTWRGATT